MLVAYTFISRRSHQGAAPFRNGHYAAFFGPCAGGRPDERCLAGRTRCLHHWPATGFRLADAAQGRRCFAVLRCNVLCL